MIVTDHDASCVFGTFICLRLSMSRTELRVAAKMPNLVRKNTQSMRSIQCKDRLGDLDFTLIQIDARVVTAMSRVIAIHCSGEPQLHRPWFDMRSSKQLIKLCA